MDDVLKAVGVVGHFGFGKNLLNGQTIKTKIITGVLEERLGEQEILKIDTHGGIFSYLKLPFQLFGCLIKCRNVLIFPARRGVQVIAPVLSGFNRFFHRRLHYCVIGGWLPEMVREREHLAACLKRFDAIYVETSAMKCALEERGFGNIFIMPNCKDLNILDESELVYPSGEPYKLCTFSRVTREKGIEDAVNAVKNVNRAYGKTVYALDIYGPIDESQTEWFVTLKQAFPEYVRYGGWVPFDASTETLRNYFALLFPTFYEGEGFAGTLIDAMSAGVPVVASDWKYNPEIVDSGRTGLLYPARNVEALTDKLMWIYEHQAEWNRMKNNCLVKAENCRPEAVTAVLIQNMSCGG